VGLGDVSDEWKISVYKCTVATTSQVSSDECSLNIRSEERCLKIMSPQKYVLRLVCLLQYV
jgi:hypothetical protein